MKVIQAMNKVEQFVEILRCLGYSDIDIERILIRILLSLLKEIADEV